MHFLLSLFGCASADSSGYSSGLFVVVGYLKVDLVCAQHVCSVRSGCSVPYFAYCCCYLCVCLILLALRWSLGVL